MPTNVTDLRSFFRFVNQLSSNTMHIAQCLQPLRPLLSTENEFFWGSDHTEAFRLAKQSFTNMPTLTFFDITKLTRIMTEASCVGLGFVLQQQHGDTWHIVQAGARFLSDTKSRYATTKKEMLGVSFFVVVPF